MSKTEKDKITVLVTQLFITTLCHPLEYVKILTQLGYEPIPPSQTTTSSGEQVMILPNVFQYLQHIKSVDGIYGLYRGLLAKVLGIFASNQITSKFINVCSTIWPDIEKPPNIFTDEEINLRDYLLLERRDIAIHLISVIISYPFDVVSVRMKAAFVGKEEHYGSLIRSLRSVHRDNGFSGFFQGLRPKLIAELSCLTVTRVFEFFTHKYLAKTKNMRHYSSVFIIFLFGGMFYPLLLVSTCMTVVGSSLRAGSLPAMPQYPSWRDCLKDLISTHQHHRGSTLIYRYYDAAPINTLTRTSISNIFNFI